jgi:hypothetical protein
MKSGRIYPEMKEKIVSKDRGTSKIFFQLNFHQPVDEHADNSSLLWYGILDIIWDFQRYFL